MRIDDLKIFIDLANTQSFSKCAEINFLTQPAVSQKIKQMENEFKTPLIVRNKRNIRLTYAGKIFYDKSRRIVDEYRDLFSNIKSLSGVVHGTVKVAAIYSVGLYELNESIKNFIKKYPSVHLDIEFSQSSKIYENIANESIDLGFIAYPQDHPGIEIIPFKKEELVLVTHPSHHLAKHKSIEIAKINNCNFIGFEDGVPTGDAVKDILKKNHINVKIKMEFDNIELIKRAVEINQGISILPSITVKEEVRHKLLNSIPLLDLNILRPLAIVIKKNHTLSLAAQKFIDEASAN